MKGKYKKKTEYDELNEVIHIYIKIQDSIMLFLISQFIPSFF